MKNTWKSGMVVHARKSQNSRESKEDEGLLNHTGNPRPTWATWESLPQRKRKVLSKLLLCFKLQFPWLISNDSYKEIILNVCKILFLIQNDSKNPQLWQSLRQTITYRKKLKLWAPGPRSSGWLLRFSQSRSWNEMRTLVTVCCDFPLHYLSLL